MPQGCLTHSATGREKEAVIVSLVRSNAEREVGFLGEKRRLNGKLRAFIRHSCPYLIRHEWRLHAAARRRMRKTRRLETKQGSWSETRPRSWSCREHVADLYGSFMVRSC